MPQAPDQKLSQKEKEWLVAIVVGGVVLGYYSPIDNRTVFIVALCSGVGAAFENQEIHRIESEFTNLSKFQRILAYGAVGAAVGAGIDLFLRPRIVPRDPAESVKRLAQDAVRPKA